ncbi:hypothetical protein GOBAR_AA33884 [Gossypium barbadense]|uniref:DUF4283 domain-containing protein n=1 Tax=Gossypium barbadense TaxID=3634 RepID=A0A2P5W6S9_GOSBA|nr:hypothetical protein GOBAR_AA33884 [Gossypium barbadense]
MKDSDVSSDDRTDTCTFTEEERNTKKVRFKVVGEDSMDNMVVDTTSVKEISWKEMLLGRTGSESGVGDSDGDLIIEDGDILRTSINGIPAINFSERLKNILIRDMETTVVVKLLGRNIGYGVLYNRISSLWKPSQPFRLMDIKNGYYLVRFQSRVDYDLALTQGPWIVFGHYLTVQPWTVEFDPLKPFPSVVTARIRFPGLPGFLYKKRILEKIGSLVGKVMKLDFKTDSGVRGQIARMAVSIDLKQPLTSQVSINGRIQRVEFEALPTVCFHYGEMEDAPVTVDKDTTPVTAVEAFGPWMVVQRKSRRNQAGKLNHQAKVAEGNPDGSRFKALFTEKNQLADFGAKKSGVDNSGAEILGLKEIAFKQGNFSRKLKDNRPGGNYGHRAEGNKGKEIVDHNRFIGLKDKASGLVHLEVEQEKAGQGQTHGDLILENKTGSNPDGSQPISTGPMESKVILDFNVLDPKRHSTVIFKGNSDHKIVATELNIRPSDSSILSAPSKGHGLDNKK